MVKKKKTNCKKLKRLPDRLQCRARKLKSGAQRVASIPRKTVEKALPTSTIKANAKKRAAVKKLQDRIAKETRESVKQEKLRFAREKARLKTRKRLDASNQARKEALSSLKKRGKKINFRNLI